MYHHLRNNATAAPLPGHAPARRFIYYDFSATPRAEGFHALQNSIPTKYTLGAGVHHRNIHDFIYRILTIGTFNHSRIYNGTFSLPIFFPPFSFFLPLLFRPLQETFFPDDLDNFVTAEKLYRRFVSIPERNRKYPAVKF